MATFTIASRPAPLPISATCIYKTVGNVSIPIDVYLPAGGHDSSTPIMLFVHGGGWSGSNRSDYSRPLFHHFLAFNFIVTSMDYRLVPESSHYDQIEDLKDVEDWLRNRLPFELGDIGVKSDARKIVVTGASAGAQLALLTPKYWKISPVAIISMYAPTDMSRVPYLGQGRLAGLVIPAVTSDLLEDATNFDHPPTEISIPKSPQDYTRPRGVMSMHVFRNSLIAEMLLRGLVREADGSLRLPEKGCLCEHELDEISPLAISRQIKYPPTYQIMGTKDEIFDISHMYDFHDSLERSGVMCEKVAVTLPVGANNHAFDMWAAVGSNICEDIIRPAVEWAVQAGGVWEGDGDA